MNLEMPNWVWMALACLLAALAIPLLMPLARHCGLVDHPHGHKTHEQSVPLVGGLGVFLAVGIVAIPAGVVSVAGWPWVVAVLAMLVLGVVDDLSPRSARLRFLWQGAVALLLIYGAGHRLHDLGDLFGQGLVEVHWLSVAFTVFCVVGVINAFNMIDGLDGLSGSLALISLMAIAYLAAFAGHSSAALAVSLLAGALVGFLAFNWPRPGGAPVFLGNGGSLALGTVLAFLFVDLSQAPYRAFAPAVALWLFAIPLIDTVSVMFRRLQEGMSPFKPDHNHVHHLLLRAGFSGQQTLLLLLSITACCAVIGMLGQRLQWPQPWLALGFVVLAIAYHLWALHAVRRSRLLGRPLAAKVSRSGT